MATKQKADKNTLIRCDHCGEYYSISYKTCPFCEEYDAFDAPDAEDSARASGGKRLVTNTRGGGYGRGWTRGRILLTVLSLGMIVAAACIVFTIIKPLVDKGKVTEPTPTPPVTLAPSETPSESPDTTPTPSSEPENSDAPAATPTPTPSQLPAGQTATSFTLNKSDFTLSKQGEAYRIKATFSPADSTGTLTWKSSDSSVVSVAQDGTVTGVGKGTATVTATLPGGASQSCIVRCTFSASATATPTVSLSPSGSFELSRTDFTLSKKGETYRIKPSGVESVSWSTSDSSVATVSGDGTVTAVGNGTCTITATANGGTQTCIVRVKF